MRRSHTFRWVAAVLLAVAGSLPATAAPRDELLRVAPPDAALILVVQNARDHVRTVMKSPFAEWFPRSAVGKKILAGIDLNHVRESAAPIFLALDTNPDELLDDVLGDAVAFAYSPAPAGNPGGERAVLLVRPRKPELLARLVNKLNEIQTGNRELKAVEKKQHNGAEYFERQKAAGGSDFYCFRGRVFAFSSTEKDVQAVIDRDAATPTGRPPELAARLDKLGVADAAAVALVNPRAFDADLKARVAAAKGDERNYLTRFEQVWHALDAAAVSVTLGADLDAAVSLEFRPDALPAGAKAWLTGPRTRPDIWQAIPDDALFAVASRFTATEFIETVGALAPGPEKNPLAAALEKGLGPVFGKDKLPRVLESLGPNWAVWAEAPAAGAGHVPVVVAAAQLDTTTPKGREAGRAVTRALNFGFNAARVAYNARHTDQIEVVEIDDGGAVITTLLNETGFPKGFRPSFTVKEGYLLVATSPDAIKRFEPPSAVTKPTAEALVGRFSGAATRNYLRTHRTELAKFLAAAGQGVEADLVKQFDQLAAVLEPVEKVELVTRGDATGIRIGLRVKLIKPLK